MITEKSGCFSKGLMRNALFIPFVRLGIKNNWKIFVLDKIEFQHPTLTMNRDFDIHTLEIKDKCHSSR
jgi:hypothetical protein